MVDATGLDWKPLDTVEPNAPTDTVIKDIDTPNLTAAEVMTQAVFMPHSAERSASFDFRLRRNNDEKLLFRDLSVYSAGPSKPRFKRRINPGGNFTICKNNEQNGQPNCDNPPDVKPLTIPEANCCRPKGHGKHH